MRFKALILCSTTLLLLSVPPSAFAQTSKGILTGVARDPSGAVIPDAAVIVTNQNTGEQRTAQTHQDGSYRIDALAPGSYTVSASHTGFTDLKTSNLAVRASVVTSYDLPLATGATSTTVTVEATNSGINTENGQLAGVISSRDLQVLPIFSLNPVDLALTVPGVQTVSQPGSSVLSNGSNIEVNGARPRANNFLLDGQEINDVGIGGQAFQPQIPDIFQSVAVITNNPSAEYGRAGGAIVNLVTKSGSNDFHGSVFERYTGSGLNALDGVLRQSKPLPVGAPNPKARYDQHQYGFTAGGPIIKDKLFAFGALQLSRYYGKETPNRLELPDAAGYATLQRIGGPQVTLLDQYLSGGDYLTSYVNLTPTNASGNPIHVSTINVGNGNNITTGYFQRQNPNESSPDTQWMYRVDFTPHQQDSFSVRYLHDRSSLSPDFFTNGSALVGFDTQQGGPTELGAGTWTHIFGSSIVNELRGSETRLSFAFSPLPATAANPLYALPTLNIAHVAVDASNSSSLGPNQIFPQGRKEELYQGQDTVSITHGRHTIRLGADIGRIIETDTLGLNAKGTLLFQSGGSGVTPLGNFLQNQLGPSGTATKTFGNTRIDPHGWRSGIFFQDDVKILPDLTLNLGIRYDYTTNPENSLPYPAVDPANPYQAINTVIKVKNDTNNIAPRFGFAYAPSALGAGKTVIRGGFGISYDSFFSNIVTNAGSGAPNAVAGTLTSTLGNGLAMATNLISSISPTLSPKSSITSGVVSNLVNPYTMQFNLGVERQLPGSNLVAVRYVGSLGKKLFANQQYNYFAPDGSGNRLNTNRGIINLRGNFAASSYNAAQVEYTHNFAHGLQINANYVFSKSLDDGSEVFLLANSPTSYSSNLAPGGRSQDWGPSSYDHRHFVSVAYSWTPGGFHSGNTFANLALGALTRNWTISGIEQFQSGSYSTFAVTGIDTNRDGSSANDRPVVGNKKAPLNTAGIDGAFPFIGGTPGTYYELGEAYNGDGGLVPVAPSSVHWLVPYQPLNQNLRQEIGRNSFLNPGTTRNDVALEKGFGLAGLHLDRGRLIFRVEAQNIANHNDVGVLDTTITDIGTSAYMNISTARKGASDQNPRQLVLWAKFTF
jgi:hypothetical protein